MAVYMLDTNICIYVIKHRPPEVLEKFNENCDSLAVSSITAFELCYGYEKSGVDRHRREVERFLSRVQVLDYGLEEASMTGKVRAQLAGKGAPVGPYNVMIAAHALTMDCILVTNNTKEFERVPTLALENWVQPS